MGDADVSGVVQRPAGITRLRWRGMTTHGRLREGRRRVVIRDARTAAVLAVLVTAFASGFGCSRDNPRQRVALLTGGDPQRAPDLMRYYGCASCHEVSGVPGAIGQVGPPLTGVGGRSYLAGRLTNTPDNMVRWIRHPRAVDPQTAMPEMGVTDQDARDIAAFLYEGR